MTATIRNIIAVAIAMIVIGFAGIITASYVSHAATEQVGPLEKAVKTVDAAGLTVTGISPYDVYGSDYQVAAIVCPGESRSSVAEKFNVDESELQGLPRRPIKEGYNYMLVGSQLGEIRTERLDRDLVDLCQVATQPFQAQAMIPLVKSPAGAWTIAAQ
ncbi:MULTISPECIES: hypothetical protein [unclassified Corynebacterium]|uniref:hypothetical protein n=1 Tax=unclassified Corynebacterium TaxID=2624378 RepID=UPI0021674783|nr:MULTISPECIES: hypothetical protein [unclassified Corynebacterium]MCS4491416.1 hypothetical protein [Corynebacterium sp. ES2715-CONJ3]MCS4531483.1 hypothetical protein [Corynebacterium sp. ES2730-CONJ]